MVADETVLILALLGDTADTLLQKVGQSGARQVQLLVPEGVPGLQKLAQLQRLRELAVQRGVTLTLISSDPQTLRAARKGGIETLQVRDAHVVVPSTTDGSPYATRVLDREPARGGVSSHLADDLSAGDAAFLDALDDLDTMPPPRAVGPSPEDEDIFAALESLDALPARGAPTADDDFMDALDSIGADDGDLRRAPPRRAEAPPAAPRRIRPEDIELTQAEKVRAKQTGKHSSTPPASPRPAVTQPMPARRSPLYDEDDAPYAPPRRRSWLVPVLLILILLVSAAVAAVLILGGSATVGVAPPVRPDQIEPINAMPIPLAAPGSGGSGTAVEAEGVVSDVAVSVSGQVTEGTMSPSGTARGTVTIYSGSPQPITLPAGTEFIAVKPDGQEVPFISGVDTTIPPATTSDQGAQIVTTRGVVNIDVAARSAGSASNVDANSIRRVAVPGGQTFNVDSGALIVQNGPITGGSEDQVWIVKDSDVQAILAQGLTQLDTQARQQLQGLASARGLQLAPTTIIPRRAELQQLQGFEYSVSPAVGETVDPQNPTFTLTVQAHYSALSTAPGALIEGQLAKALTEQLRQAGLLQPGDCKAPAITGWRWDGERLTVDGQIAPNTQDPACGPGLSDSVLQQVRDAVRGKSRYDADAALQTLQQQGLIGTYVLPNVDQLPGWDFQLRVEAR
ncbi:hypothetical protein EKD04_019350 [Chloroflexales bacterium ZM16-3]|nr:hypothetical protein [Chloroflexales bacterium ZM16-3]